MTDTITFTAEDWGFNDDAEMEEFFEEQEYWDEVERLERLGMTEEDLQIAAAVYDRAFGDPIRRFAMGYTSTRNL